MGVKGRKLKHSAKMERKRAQKAARRALYASMAGTSKKGKRSLTQSTQPSRFKGMHTMLNCGNTGCRRCYPR